MLCYLIYWQMTGRMERIRDVLESKQFRRLIDERYYANAEILVVVVVVVNVLFQPFIGGWALACELLGVKPTSGVIFPSPSGLPYGYIPSTFIMVHAVSVGYVVTGFHALCFLYVRHLFNQQNLRITALTTLEKDRLAEGLKREIHSYMALGEALHTLNDTLKTHLLARTLLTVPRLVFSLWYLKQILPRPLEILGAVHECVDTIVELVALVVIPAGVHSAIKEGETAICRNTHFWTPCDERLFLRAQTLLSLAKQSDLGISLGCVTVITTTLLWTLVSLLITFLTIFIDVRQAPTFFGGAFWNSSNSV